LGKWFFEILDVRQQSTQRAGYLHSAHPVAGVIHDPQQYKLYAAENAKTF
jgi:hypothetical protein